MKKEKAFEGGGGSFTFLPFLPHEKEANVLFINPITAA